LYPRSRSLARASGTGTTAARSSTTSDGHASRAIRSDIAGAMAFQPEYFNAWIISPAVPAETQQ
jgi:hypothetical protein